MESKSFLKMTKRCKLSGVKILFLDNLLEIQYLHGVLTVNDGKIW